MGKHSSKKKGGSAAQLLRLPPTVSSVVKERVEEAEQQFGLPSSQRFAAEAVDKASEGKEEGSNSDAATGHPTTEDIASSAFETEFVTPTFSTEEDESEIADKREEEETEPSTEVETESEEQRRANALNVLIASAPPGLRNNVSVPEHAEKTRKETDRNESEERERKGREGEKGRE